VKHGLSLFGSRKTFTLANSAQDPSFLRIPLGFWASCLLGLPSSRFQFAEINVVDGSTDIFHNRYISLEEPDEEEYHASNFGSRAGAMWEIDGKGDLWQGDYFHLKTKLDLSVQAQLFEVNRTFTNALAPYNAAKCSERACNHKSFLDSLGLVNTECSSSSAGICVDPFFRSKPLQNIARWIDIDQLLSLFAMEMILGHCDGLMVNRNNAYAFFISGLANSTSSGFRFAPWGIDQIFDPSATSPNIDCISGPKQMLQRVFDRNQVHPPTRTLHCTLHFILQRTFVL
jgi:hypothetical protein